ncbi:hypothetical protein OHT76_01355 [Streptomyces sp. NBC_00287]|uniref:hypothetical protein n=1 Tax=Streptomyces sp. NBC_00287 TaxID=2975702 RepID=UPI002E2C5C63|nr:hypothetical protein [Streptomyces sp. NBC_00287]
MREVLASRRSGYVSVVDTLTWISAAVALASASTAALLGYWQQRRIASVERLNYMDRYGASLAWAAFDLQSRLFNILSGRYLTMFLVQGTDKEAELARRSTVFVIAEYLGWVEILRRDVQFLDLGSSRSNRQVMTQLSEIAETFNRATARHDEFRLFRIQQRAIGSVMIHPGGEPGRRRCLDYVEFCELLDADSRFAAWFSELLADVDVIATDMAPAEGRLRSLQRELVELINLLDPDAVRFPQFHRQVYTP